MRSARPCATWLTGWSQCSSDFFFSFGRGGCAPGVLAFAQGISILSRSIHPHGSQNPRAPLPVNPKNAPSQAVK